MAKRPPVVQTTYKPTRNSTMKFVIFAVLGGALAAFPGSAAFRISALVVAGLSLLGLVYALTHSVTVGDGWVQWSSLILSRRFDAKDTTLQVRDTVYNSRSLYLRDGGGVMSLRAVSPEMFGEGGRQLQEDLGRMLKPYERRRGLGR